MRSSPVADLASQARSSPVNQCREGLATVTVFLYSNFMSTHILNRLGHFYGSYDLNAICYRCDHTTPLDVSSLVEEFGDDLDMDRFGRQLRCSVCGGGDCGIMKVWHGGRDFSKIWL